MSIARDISRQTSRQSVTLTADQTAVTVTGGFSSSTVEVYLNGAKLVQGSDYTLNGTSGITLTQGASVGDIIEFSIRNSSNSGISAVNTSEVIDGAVTFGKLSNSSTEDDNVQKRTAGAWINFNMTNAVIRDDFNVSSITYEGTGRYTVTFEKSFADTNYCFCVNARDADNSVAGSANLGSVRSAGGKTTSTLEVISAYAPTTTASNTTEYGLIVFGELS
tara:strand:+ start:74 stop:733 length:660 start_codon:yes stop_codon:yes gene_type:complete